MQIKVVIGTIAFMLVMIILGVAALVEPARLESTTDAFVGRQIENGAALYQDNCTECHGTEGKAENCVDFSGEEVACVGMPLNHAALLCGEPSLRMQQVGWEGTKYNFIFQTISAGRPGTQMPTWAEVFGGPMEQHQIDQLTTFILNWGQDPDLCGDDGAPVLEAVDWPESYEDLPEGDADNGAAQYTSYACHSCHGDPAVPGSNAVGPHLGNIGNDAVTRVDGVSGEQYVYDSILNPDLFMAHDCPNGPCTEPSLMMSQGYDTRLGLQDMADLVAYYMTLTNE